MKKVNFIKSALIKMFLVFVGFYSLSTNIVFSQDLNATKFENVDSFKLISTHSMGTFMDNEAYIHRDFEMTAVGIKAFFRLIKLNQKTGEFNSTFVKGRFYKNKAEVMCKRFWLYQVQPDARITYSADRIDSIDNKIILKGNAKIIRKNSEKEFIDADEIIINILDKKNN